MKRKICLLLVLLAALSLAGCGRETLSYEFRDDENGRIAERFFPDHQALPDSVRSAFEYRRKASLYGNPWYDGYYLKLVFDIGAEYERFLEETEHDFPDMTEEQREHSYFIIEQVRFTVEDYSFRAINLGDADPYIGLIAHCDPEKTVVFLYFYHDLASIEDISDGLGPHGYMDYYADTWSAK